MIYITGDITVDSFVEFAKQMSKNANNTVQISLISSGGDAQAALAYYDLIKAHGSCYIVATGYVASAAVLILAAGKKRYMTKNAWVMVHEESVTELAGDVRAIEREARQLRRYEDQWARILASVTNASAEQWTELHKAETFMMAEQCLAYGLIEEII